MKHIPRWSRHLALAAAAGLATTACAGTPDTFEGDLRPDQSYVVVDNTNTTISSATIYIYPSTGVRERLGTVTMNDEATFEVEPGVTTEYRLVAEHGVDELASRAFTLTEGDAVEWNLALNQISYRRDTGR